MNQKAIVSKSPASKSAWHKPAAPATAVGTTQNQGLNGSTSSAVHIDGRRPVRIQQFIEFGQQAS